MASKNDFAISFSDLPYLFVRHKKKFFFCLAFFTFLGFYWGLTSRPTFEAKGIFRESQKSGPSLPGGEMKSVFLMAGGGKQSSDAIALMKSRSIMVDAIHAARLQAIVVPIQRFPSFHAAKDQTASFFSRFFYGLPAAYEEEEYEIEAETNYGGEKAVAIDLEFTKNGYNWKNLSTGEQGSGKIGETIRNQTYSWTLFNPSEKALPEDKRRLILQPLDAVVKGLQNAVRFESSLDSTSFTFVTARLPNRKKASEVVNAVMNAHVKFLNRENRRLAKEQIAYLNRREGALAGEMAEILREHAGKISSQFIATGFSNSEQLMQFLAKNEETYQTQLMKTELDLRLFKELGKNGSSNPAIGKELDTLSQQKEMLSLALKKSTASLKELHLTELFQDLSEIRALHAETKALSAALTEDGQLPETPHLDHYPGAGVLEWKRKIHDSINENIDLKGPFQRYLDQLARYFQIEEKTLAAKLSYNQDLSGEFGSLDIDATTTLIRRFTEELQTLDSSIAEKEFYIKEVALNDSQLTALTSSSTDPTLQLIGKKATEIVLAQYDSDNRSNREQERLDQELSLQRTFLKDHLQQTKKVMGLKKALLQEKVRYLQKLSLGLIEQRIAVLQRRVEEQNRSQLRGLENERDLLADQQKKLRLPATEIADNWVREKNLDQKLTLHRRMIEEVSRLVESQNITSNLETLQSSALDKAVPPLSPRFFPFIVYTIAGACLGVFFGSFAVLGASLTQGVEATLDNLRASGQDVAGIFKTTDAPFEALKKEELDPLRIASHFLEAKSNRSFVVSVPKKNTLPIYLSRLFALRDKKVLLVDLAASGSPPSGSPSFWDWEASSKDVPMAKEPLTVLSCMENPPYASEIVLSDRFRERLSLLQSSFDYVFFAADRTSLPDPLLFALLQKIPDGLIVLSSEPLELVEKLEKESSASLCFLFAI